MHEHFIKNVNDLSVCMTVTEDGAGTNVKVCTTRKTARQGPEHPLCMSIIITRKRPMPRASYLATPIWRKKISTKETSISTYYLEDNCLLITHTYLYFVFTENWKHKIVFF